MASMPPLRPRRPHSRAQQSRSWHTMHSLSPDASWHAPAPGVNKGSKRFETPLLGSFYLTDLVVAAVTVAWNVLCTCTLVETLDLLYFALVYHVGGGLWRDMRRLHFSPQGAQGLFHLYMLCFMHMLLQHAPFLPPRIALAAESTGPLVQWRTGGGAAQVIRAYWHAPAFRAFWMGGTSMQTNRTVVLYVHGGGFALGSVALYAEPLLRLLAHMSLRRPSSAVECVALEYELAPHVRFPTPLLEALRCYAHLIEHEHIPPSQIVVAGDSAGANLVMGLLLCLAGQATADVSERDWCALPMPAKAVLISPWLDLRPQEAVAVKSVRASCAPAFDILTPESLVQFAQLYTQRLLRPRRLRGPCTRWLTRLQRCCSWRPAAWLAARLQRPLLMRHAPLIQLADASTDAVPGPRDMLDASSLAAPKCAADRLLHAHPLVSPTLGRWDAVRLEHGFFVTWGANELMAPDIAAWTARLPHVETYVEPGPTGVHVWPFLHALLAPTVHDRERGLQRIAHALCLPSPPSVLSSPASMPSDVEDDGESAAAAQRAWDAELARLGVHASGQ
ncbi:hypothetical protein MCAP1_003010 [Malassezia caprae]|uniref:Alpha/beta hydrolase fold-3 domain-containing protein n=1 Tax=Malassezia caprae TaxID=1381934 RepID=A0AAF0E6T4_9BASI|nr:hypothetical protein MCAP1_003010 [Malassezia caprae]